jgi:dipeptidyl aminopeptidase/acylaminoacyl peptidase
VLSRRRPWIEPAKQATPAEVSLTSRDGLPLHGVLTLPPGSSGKNLPMVVLPHGGPYEIFDAWGYDTETQILAQHGYAVLQVNFRGSGGYGLEFSDKGLRQWGGGMQNDIADATRHVLAQGIADPKRVCIYGGSYGGYAALMEPVRDPDLYRCAAGMAGVYDLSKMYKWGSIRHGDYGKQYLNRAIGTDPAELAANSPLNNVEKMKLPIFLAHGRLDGRVDVKHAHRMYEALQDAKADVEYFEIPQTGHGIALGRYREEFYARLLRFLDKNLGAVAPASAAASN